MDHVFTFVKKNAELLIRLAHAIVDHFVAARR